MKFLLNVIWLIFGGLWLALGYFLAGIICCVLIVTIPFDVVRSGPSARPWWTSRRPAPVR